MPSYNAVVSELWDRILAPGVTFLQDGLVASSTPEGPNAFFYDQFFDSDLTPDASRRSLWRRLKEIANAPALNDPFVEVLDQIERAVGSDAVVLEVGGGVYQGRSAFAYKRFSRYVPLDLSHSSICRYAKEFKRPGIVADATKIPIRDASVDAVYTRTFLEHVSEPESALREIFRIVRPGGIIIHQDAWFCRWWQRYAVVGLMPWREMHRNERLVFLASRVTEIKALRACRILLARVAREILFRRSRRLHFGRLSPNYDLRLGCDEDAASSLDPAEVYRFYAVMGGHTAPFDTSLKRVLARPWAVVVRKPPT